MLVTLYPDRFGYVCVLAAEAAAEFVVRLAGRTGVDVDLPEVAQADQELAGLQRDCRRCSAFEARVT